MAIVFVEEGAEYYPVGQRYTSRQSRLSAKSDYSYYLLKTPVRWIPKPHKSTFSLPPTGDPLALGRPHRLANAAHNHDASVVRCLARRQYPH